MKAKPTVVIPPTPHKHRIAEKAARVLDALDILSCRRDADFGIVIREIRNAIGGHREKAQIIDTGAALRINFGNGTGGATIKIAPDTEIENLFWVTISKRTVSVREAP